MVLAVAGTHGKTTTSSMLAWIIENTQALRGISRRRHPENFGISARQPGEPRQEAGGQSPFFVIEADEYDTAFRQALEVRPLSSAHRDLNNLEYDHADIFHDLAAIETQFHHPDPYRSGQRPRDRQRPGGQHRARARARLLVGSRNLRHRRRLVHRRNFRRRFCRHSGKANPKGMCTGACSF